MQNQVAAQERWSKLFVEQTLGRYFVAALTDSTYKPELTPISQDD